MPKLTQALLLATLPALLIACGGGGGGGEESPPASSLSSNSSTTSSNTSPIETTPEQPSTIGVQPPTPNNTDTADTSSDEPATENNENQAENDVKTITISWTPPSTRKNGDTLLPSEISGFAIYYYQEGSNAEDGEVVVINDANINEYTTPELTAGTYYFSIATIDEEGIYSDLSDYVEAEIN